MNGKLSWAIFWALVGVFVVIVCQFSIPAFRDLLRGSLLFLLPFAAFFLLGIALLVFTLREKVGGVLKKFFLLTGASAAGIFVSILLHNAIYGLFIYWFGADFWKGGDEPFFFIMAIIVCPVGFLVGAVGSIVLGIKNYRMAKKSASSPQ
ncbi:MAG: hypothetical protein ISS51_03215 [Dehalococcoidales bacterium]|nr:hypothetical protein [Dehalococcoidales bacterium]